MDNLEIFRDSQTVIYAPILQPDRGGGGNFIMEDRDLWYFRGILTQSLEDLLKRNGETVSLLLESTVRASDPVDKAALEADRTFNIRMRDRENKLIHKIKQSLLRIEEGTFDICEVCGEEISINRLKARPVTTYCIDCVFIQGA